VAKRKSASRQRLAPITGPELIKLLVKDGWVEGRMATHGRSLSKRFSDRTRVTIVPTKNEPLTDGTLAAILGPKQAGLGKSGLRELIAKYG